MEEHKLESNLIVFEKKRHYREKEGIRGKAGLESEIHERVRLESRRRFERDFVGKKKKKGGLD